ncbi:Hypothetical protein, predicted lipoprotein [Metamycoplasma auris 15026]|uniref:Transglutaminase-like domain-containing protein n=1 Tax=Metamycoplasma auris 15026 TaxID=1188233 RepID=N9TQW2_9BACT|nr:transglutaminase domain-containing protein [Metamycoplasma auris]ENY68544.1 Hypothetical protein, predicted lipoprotein [Metamycoplasma auris 15026]
MKKSNKMLLGMLSLSSFSLFPIFLSSCEKRNEKINEIINNRSENNFADFNLNKNKKPKEKENYIEKSPTTKTKIIPALPPKINETISNNFPQNNSSTHSSNSIEKPINNPSATSLPANEINKIETKEINEIAEKNEVIESPIDNKIEVNNHIENIEEDTNKIEMSNEEISNFYPSQNNSHIEPKKLSVDEIKDLIINKMYASNYYESPDFVLENNTVSLNKKLEENETIKLKLLDAKTKNEINNVRWFQRLRYLNDLVLEENQDDPNSSITLTSNGMIKKKKTPEAHKNDIAELWGEHQGFLYKVLVHIGGEDEERRVFEEEESKKKAKEITKDWTSLPILQQIKKAHDWIVQNIMYVDTKDIWKDQSAYSALVQMQAICTGYARAFKMLMDELGIPSSIITGEMDQSLYPNYHTRHAWNLVEIDGQWYHVDTTTDHIIYQTNKKKKRNNSDIPMSYKFFLIHDNDFGKGNSYFNYFEKRMGQDFRSFYHLENGSFVKNKEEALKQFDRLYSPEDANKLPKWLDLYGNENLFEEIKEAFLSKGYRIKNSALIRANDEKTWKMGYRKFRFEFDNEELKNKLNKENIDFSIEKHSELILKVTLDKSKIKNDKLDAANFLTNKGLVKKVEETSDGYLVYLDHFETYGKKEVKLEIKKFGYKFNSKNNSIELNIEKHQTPQAKLIAIDSNKAILTNVKEGMEYRNNSLEWKEIKSDNFEISDLVPGSISVRYKKNNNKLASDIQTIQMHKASDIDNQIKTQNNTLIGVNAMMEYRLKNTQKWIPIQSNKITNLKQGTYQIRTKANNTTLASQTYEITVS